MSLVGYTGEACVPDVEQNDRITKHLIGNPFQSWNRAWFLLWAPLKVLYQVRMHRAVRWCRQQCMFVLPCSPHSCTSYCGPC